MSDPISFESASARFSLPLLFAGQAQKEAFVNEALAVIDGLMHCAIEGQASTPPSTPIDGAAWLVGPGPTAEWAGKTGSIALRQLGQWLFAAPVDGMRILDRSSGQCIHRYSGAWRTASVPAPVTGGTVIDVEVRAALSALINALRQTGIFPL